MGEPEDQPESQGEGPAVPHPPTEPTPVLHYQPPPKRGESAPSISTRWQAGIGFLAWLGFLGTTFATVSPLRSDGAVFTMIAIAVLILIGICTWLRLEHDWRGFIPGVLLGFTITCLVPVGILAVVCGLR